MFAVSAEVQNCFLSSEIRAAVEEPSVSLLVCWLKQWFHFWCTSNMRINVFEM